jgi:hypothetical protein
MFTGDARHESCVALLDVPDPDVALERKQFAAQRQRIRLAAKIDASLTK